MKGKEEARKGEATFRNIWRSGRKTSEVDEYIERQKTPQREIVQRLRSIILKTFHGIKEEVKMGVPWYEGKFYVVALRDHVNLGFSVKGLSEQEIALFEGKGQLMRHMKFYSLMDVDEARVVMLLKLVAEKSVGC
jgi:hypothetical protein